MCEDKSLNTEASSDITEQDEYWMNQALILADKAEQQGEIPVGAVIVKGNQLLAEGWNQSISLQDATAHAEIMAIRAAGKQSENYRLVDATLYVTLEPCAMCATALVHARIKRVVYGAYDEKTGAVSSVMELLLHSSMNHQVASQGGVLKEVCGNKLSQFFKQRRAEIKAAKRAKPST